MEDIESGGHETLFAAFTLVIGVAIIAILLTGTYNLRFGLQEENAYHAHNLATTLEAMDSVSAHTVIFKHTDDLKAYKITFDNSKLTVGALDKDRHLTYEFVPTRLVSLQKNFVAPEQLTFTKTPERLEVTPSTKELSSIEKEEEITVETKKTKKGTAYKEAEE